MSISGCSIRQAQPGAFAEREIGLLQTFAAQAVIAIENVRLFTEIKEALERQTAMAEVLEVISNSVEDTQPVFERILESCQRLIECTDLSVLTIEADALVYVRAARGPHAWLTIEKYRPVPVGKSVIKRAVEEGETVHKLDDDIRPELIVVLSDINMPGMDGLGLLQEVKRRNAGLPVIMVTAYGDDERRRKAGE